MIFNTLAQSCKNTINQKMPISPLIIVSSLMIFILLFFAAFLFYKGRHIYSNVLLGLYLTTQIIGIVNGKLFLFNDYLLPEHIHFFYIGYPVVFTWLALYYLFICSLIDTRYRIKSYRWLHFLPAILVLLLLMKYFYFVDEAEKIKLLDHSSGFLRMIRILDLLFSIQVVIYNIAVITKYNSYRKKVKELTNIKPEYDNWIRVAIFTFLIACIITIVGKSFMYLNIPVKFQGFLISDLAFLFFYSILFFVSITSPGLVHNEESKGKYWYSTLSSFEARELMIQLDNYVKETQIYRKPGLTIKELGSGMGLSERHLSQVINDVNCQNFYDFINYYRVEHAKRLLKKNTDNRRTMFDIFWESGFNSKTTFNTSFKKFTGQTPSEYQRGIIIT
jgi:AraC-like DNA-binding protein